MKQGNMGIENINGNKYEFRLFKDGWGSYLLLEKQDVSDLRDCINETIGKEKEKTSMQLYAEKELSMKSQPLKEGQEIDEGVFVRKFKDGGWEVHGFNEDSAKEVISALKMLIPSQPIKEEEGECCGEWTGKDSYDCDKDDARTKQGTCKCKCHQEKETPGEWITAFDPSCLKCVEKESLHFEHTRQEKETEKETPKKLPSPSARIQEIRERLYNQLPNKPEKQLDKTIAQIGCHSKAIEVYLHETAKL